LEWELNLLTRKEKLIMTELTLDDLYRLEKDGIGRDVTDKELFGLIALAREALQARKMTAGYEIQVRTDTIGWLLDSVAPNLEEASRRLASKRKRYPKAEYRILKVTIQSEGEEDD